MTYLALRAALPYFWAFGPEDPARLRSRVWLETLGPINDRLPQHDEAWVIMQRIRSAG